MFAPQAAVVNSDFIHKGMPGCLVAGRHVSGPFIFISGDDWNGNYGIHLAGKDGPKVRTIAQPPPMLCLSLLLSPCVAKTVHIGSVVRRHESSHAGDS
jgi:hypothetical protein